MDHENNSSAQFYDSLAPVLSPLGEGKAINPQTFYE